MIYVDDVAFTQTTQYHHRSNHLNGEASDLLGICDDQDNTELMLVHFLRIVLACDIDSSLREAG